MKKEQIKGKNGLLELNNKYIYLSFGENENNIYEEHIIWFEEIEEILYKKPTKERYGFISIILVTGIILNKKKKYTIILDKIDDKSLSTNKKIFSFIKSTIDNKKVKVKEIIENKAKEEENIIEKEPPKEDIEITIIEPNKTNEHNKPKDNKIHEINISLSDEIKEDNKKIENESVESKTNIIIPYENIKEIEEVKVDLSNKIDESKKEDIKKDDEIIDNDYLVIEKNTNDFFEEDYLEEEQVEEQDFADQINLVENNDKETIEEKENIDETETIKDIKSLESKISSLEKQLQTLTYKEIIINRYINDINDRNKLDKLVIELKNIIEKLEKTKKEIEKQEKSINKSNNIRISSGNIVLKNINMIDNKNELNIFLSTYNKAVKQIDQIQKDANELSNDSERKRKELKISEEEYNSEINMFRDVKNNKDFIKKYINESKESLKNVKWRIEKTISPQVKYKYVRKSISSQTKMLASITALNAIRPKRSRFSMIALSLFTGVSTISDLLGYDIKKVEYNKVIQKEILEGFDSIDTSKARDLINNSKSQIDSILYTCEKRYSNYPNFIKLKKDLINLKIDIENEEKELDIIDEKLYDYKMGPKVKILKYNQE